MCAENVPALNEGDERMRAEMENHVCSWVENQLLLGCQFSQADAWIQCSPSQITAGLCVEIDKLF